MRIVRLALACCFLITGCTSLQPLQYRRTDDFSITGRDSALMVNFGLVFHNPNNYGCTVTAIESEGSLNGRLVFNAGMANRFKVRRKADFTIPVTTRLAALDLQQLLGAGLNLLLNEEAIPMKVHGRIRLRKFIFSKTYPFDYTQGIDKALLKKLF